MGRVFVSEKVHFSTLQSINNYLTVIVTPRPLQEQKKKTIFRCVALNGGTFLRFLFIYKQFALSAHMDIAQRLKQNWKSGLTVSLVSIPLSISLAVASQTTPTAGIITAIWAGLIAALFGGSNFNIVGPTGALSGLVGAYAIAHGADTLPTLAVVSGLIILIAYLAKLERFLVFVPGSTMQGFTLGVAFVIGLNQLNYALGLSGLTRHEKFIDNLGESLKHVGQTSGATFFVFLVFLVAMFALLKLVPKIPGAILLSPIGILLGYATTNGYIHLPLQTLAGKYGDLGRNIIQLPHFAFVSDTVVAAFGVALVAILETMISAKIADTMSKTRHNERKEMLGLGLANIASGLAGGIPATAALARTSLNVKTHATHSTSAAISSVCIAIISGALITYFKFIPMAVIGAILVFVAARMVEVHHFKRMWKFDRFNFWLALSVAAITVATDPIMGILIGTAVSAVIFLEKLSHGTAQIWTGDKKGSKVDEFRGDKLGKLSGDAEVLTYSIRGQLIYLNAQAHVSRFEKGLARQYTSVILHLKDLTALDADGIEALNEIITICQSHKVDVCLACASAPILEQLQDELSQFKNLQKHHRVCPNSPAALEALGFAT